MADVRPGEVARVWDSGCGSREKFGEVRRRDGEGGGWMSLAPAGVVNCLLFDDRCMSHPVHIRT